MWPWLQVEGAFVFGLGMMTTEEVVIDPQSGRLLTDSTWTYKIPTAPCVPAEFNVSFLKVTRKQWRWTSMMTLNRAMRSGNFLPSVCIWCAEDFAARLVLQDSLQSLMLAFDEMTLVVSLFSDTCYTPGLSNCCPPPPPPPRVI